MKKLISCIFVSLLLASNSNAGIYQPWASLRELIITPTMYFHNPVICSSSVSNLTTTYIGAGLGTLTNPSNVLLLTETAIQLVGNGSVTGTWWNNGIAYFGDAVTCSSNVAILGRTTHTKAVVLNDTLLANLVFTLGDGGDVGSVNTSDWDIGTTGTVTGCSIDSTNFPTDGISGTNVKWMAGGDVIGNVSGADTAIASGRTYLLNGHADTYFQTACTKGTVKFVTGDAGRHAVGITGVTKATICLVSWVGDTTSAAIEIGSLMGTCKAESLIILCDWDPDSVEAKANGVNYLIVP